MIELSWADFKSRIDNRSLRFDAHEDAENYYLAASDASVIFTCSLAKDSSTDTQDYEDNYAASANQQLGALDPDTGMIATTPKWAPLGWLQVYHEIEFKTSQLNSIHDKGFDNVDTGFSSIKFYDAAGDELTIQADIDTDCVRTEYDFMPDHDYAIKSGMVAQISSPNEPVYLWALGAPGLANIPFCDGGINLEFIDGKTLVGLDGTAATILYYSHPKLGDGAGTNKIRFIVRHSAGFKHRIQAIFEYFKAAS
jgi:hypothetical protein